jgi:hypothetical protein
MHKDEDIFLEYSFLCRNQVRSTPGYSEHSVVYSECTPVCYIGVIHMQVNPDLSRVTVSYRCFTAPSCSDVPFKKRQDKQINNYLKTYFSIYIEFDWYQ